LIVSIKLECGELIIMFSSIFMFFQVYTFIFCRTKVITLICSFISIKTICRISSYILTGTYEIATLVIKIRGDIPGSAGAIGFATIGG